MLRMLFTSLSLVFCCHFYDMAHMFHLSHGGVIKWNALIPILGARNQMQYGLFSELDRTEMRNFYRRALGTFNSLRAHRPTIIGRDAMPIDVSYGLGASSQTLMTS